MASDKVMRLYSKGLEEKRLLSRAEEKALAKKVSRGNTKAIKVLIESNLRFVIKIAARYQGQGVKFNDLVSEGNLALIAAAYRFDYSKNTRFISFAVWGIRAALIKLVAEQGRPVKIPTGRTREKHEADVITTDDRFTDKNQEPIDTQLYKKEMGQKIKVALDALSSVEKQVISFYFGFKGRPYSNKEVGIFIKRTPERARQIKKTALTKLKRELLKQI